MAVGSWEERGGQGAARSAARALAGVLASVLLLLATWPVAPVAASVEEIARVVALTNVERQKAGLQPLVANPQLAAAAQGYAVVLATGTCWAHTCGPVPDFAERAVLAGYTGWSSLAENIAGGQPTPEQVVAAWMASEGHRKNILNPAFNEIGAGVARGGRYGTYWTQVFGARKITLPAPTPAPVSPVLILEPVQPALERPEAAPVDAGGEVPAEPAQGEVAQDETGSGEPAEGVAGAVDPAPAEAAAPSPADREALAASLGMSVLELQALDLINLDRLGRGIAPLEWDPLLAEVARAHAADMMTAGFIGHTGSDGSTPLQRMRRAGAVVQWGGENVWTYWGRVPHEGPPTMHAAMMDEPHEPGLWNHIANILLPTYRRVGIGIVVNERGVQYMAQNFAS